MLVALPLLVEVLGRVVGYLPRYSRLPISRLTLAVKAIIASVSTRIIASSISYPLSGELSSITASVSSIKASLALALASLFS